MAEALVKSSTFLCYREATFGVAPDLEDLVDHAIEVSGIPTFGDTYEQIERDVTRKAFSSYAPIRGIESTSASFPVELHGSGANATAPEGLELYRSAFGYCIGPVGETITDATLGTTVAATPAYTKSDSGTYEDPQMYEHKFDVTSSTGFQVGYPCRVTDSTGATLRLVGFILSITTNTITVLSSEPVLAGVIATDLFDCGYLFTLRKKDLEQVAELPSLTNQYYRGDIARETYVGNIVTQLDIDFATGQLVLPSFTMEGTSVSYDGNSGAVGKFISDLAAADPSEAGTSVTYDSENADPIVCTLTDVFMESLEDTPAVFEECISNLQFSLTNEIYKKQCIQTTGIGKIIRTARNVTGSLNTFYASESFGDDFKSNVSYNLRALFNYTTSMSAGVRQQVTTPGNVIAVAIPKLNMTEVSISEDTGIFKYDNTFSAEPTGSGDNELMIAIL